MPTALGGHVWIGKFTCPRKAVGMAPKNCIIDGQFQKASHVKSLAMPKIIAGAKEAADDHRARTEEVPTATLRGSKPIPYLTGG